LKLAKPLKMEDICQQYAKRNPTTKPKEKAQVKAGESKKDDIDLFDDDNEENANVMKELQKKYAEEEKPAPIAKSLVILHICVWDSDEDYDALAQKIITITRDGIFWKTEYQLRDIAFGLNKIVIGVVIEDDKVSIHEIVEEIESWEDKVKSVDIATFKKI
jgi:translation elongation factor EF-1beta